MWARIILEDDHGIKPSDVIWVRGGIEDPGRPEKITIKLPDGVSMVNAPEGTTISELLERGDVDAFIAPRVPSLAGRHPNIGWLFPDPVAAGKDYFKRTGIFPIMHVTGIRRELVEKHPWLPAAVFKAFEQSKAKCLEALEDTAATKVTLPFVEEQLRAAREFMGADFWSYGLGRQPQGAGDVPAPSPCPGPVLAPRLARGAVPPLDPRALHDLTRTRAFRS